MSCERRGAHPVAADPLFDDDELRSLGFEPWDGGAVDAAIVQADHAAYARLTPAELPGVRAVVDGRGILDPATWQAAGVALRGIGGLERSGAARPGDRVPTEDHASANK